MSRRAPTANPAASTEDDVVRMRARPTYQADRGPIGTHSLNVYRPEEGANQSIGALGWFRKAGDAAGTRAFAGTVHHHLQEQAQNKDNAKELARTNGKLTGDLHDIATKRAALTALEAEINAALGSTS